MVQTSIDIARTLFLVKKMVKRGDFNELKMGKIYGYYMVCMELIQAD